MTDTTISEHAELWKAAAALIKPELRDFVSVVPSEVHHLVELARCTEDPAAWLGAEFNKRGQHKKDLREFHATKRRQEDAAKIKNVASWPGPRLHLKTQPWQNEGTLSMRFGHIFPGAPLTVHSNGKTIIYDTLEELVDMWSVD